MNVFLLFLTGVGLSMDAFSVSLAYGTVGAHFKDKLLLSLITGIFHFFMPLFGFLIGKFIFSFFTYSSDIIVSLIFFSIGIQMFISSFKNDIEIKAMNFVGYFLFALAVSIDSFSVGISLTKFDDMAFLSPFVFFFCSSFFTYFGLSIGNKIERLLGKLATFLGAFLLILIGLKFLFFDH